MEIIIPNSSFHIPHVRKEITYEESCKKALLVG